MIRTGGFVHPLAVIGSVPEHRDVIWKFHRGDYGQYSQPFFLPVIDQTAIVNAFCTVDAGLHEPTRIGAHTLLMARVHVGHDAQIGANCELAPGTTLGGHVVLEDGVRCGVGVLIRPFIRVGTGARLGAGAVVVKDVPPGEVWVGNPARPLPKRLEATGEFLTDSEIEGWEALATGCA